MKHKDIIIRPVEEQDTELLRIGHNDSSVLNKLTNHLMINQKQQKLWFDKLCGSETSFGLSVISPGLGLIGYVRLDNYDCVNKNICVGGDIFHNYRGKGYGSQMFEACLIYVFNKLNCHRAYLSVLENNQVAMNMYKKYGFSEEGKQKEAIYRNGVYLDYINMYLLKQKFYEDIYKGGEKFNVKGRNE